MFKSLIVLVTLPTSPLMFISFLLIVLITLPATPLPFMPGILNNVIPIFHIALLNSKFLCWRLVVFSSLSLLSIFLHNLHWPFICSLCNPLCRLQGSVPRSTPPSWQWHLPGQTEVGQDDVE